MSSETRTWIYRIIGAAVPLLVALGYFTDEIARHVLAVSAAVLAIGGSALALKNISPDETIILTWDEDGEEL